MEEQEELVVRKIKGMKEGDKMKIRRKRIR